MALYQRALDFATVAHEGQVRKYTGEPYITHPIHVANIVQDALTNGGPLGVDLELAQVVALLHDTVEDCGVTFGEIEDEFGLAVVQNLFWLTDCITKEFGGRRRTRKMLEAQKLSRAPLLAKVVKLADFISNTESIVQHDPNFASVYLNEKSYAVRQMEENMSLSTRYLGGVDWLFKKAQASIFVEGVSQ